MSAADNQKCNLCGGTEFTLFLTGQALDRWSGPVYRYLRCTTCDLVKLEGTLETRSDDYEGSGYYGTRRTLLAPILGGLLSLLERSRLKAVQRMAPHLATGRLLDIGSGKGRFLHCARSRGWDVIGLEPVQRAPANDENDLEVVREYLRPDIWEEQQFDLVTLWHVIEHLPDPLEALRMAHRWLRSDGAVALALPNLASWQARIGGHVWFHLDPPRHLHHFSPATLSRLLEEAGFVEVRTTFPIFGLNTLGMVQTVLNRLGFAPNLLYNLVKRNRAGLPPRRARLLVEASLCLCALLALSLPLAVLIPAESIAQRGGTMIVVARKRRQHGQ